MSSSPRMLMATVYSRKARVRINGKTVVETSTEGRSYNLASAIAYASLEERLHPGEFFGSGTLPGGCALENGCWLEPGDTIECEIEDVGCTRNVVGHPAQEAAGPLRGLIRPLRIATLLVGSTLVTRFQRRADGVIHVLPRNLIVHRRVTWQLW